MNDSSTIYYKFSNELFSWRTPIKTLSCFNNSFHIFIFFSVLSIRFLTFKEVEKWLKRFF
jgi:hypothetical protein